jgi:arginine exporter protein ArgO
MISLVNRAVRWTGTATLMLVVVVACLIADLVLGMHCIGGGDRSCRVASPGLRFAVLGGTALVGCAAIGAATARRSLALALGVTAAAIVAAALAVALLPS